MCSSLSKEEICGWFQAVSVVQLIMLKNNLFCYVLRLFFSHSYQSDHFSKKASVSISALQRQHREVKQHARRQTVSARVPINRVPAWPTPPLCPLWEGRGALVFTCWCYSQKKGPHLVQKHRVDSHLPWLLRGQRKAVVSVPVSWSRLWESILDTFTGITDCAGGIQAFWLDYSHSVYDWEEAFYALDNDV